ncbi:MAG: hypothetical protein LBE82_09310, partial [Chitinophagaceae bacterium]|nr:hypothetical protein [Chitinophagaceae bacterium]
MGETYYFSPLSFPVNVMAKPVGPMCNMDCDYCYYLEKTELYEGRKEYKMPETVLERYVSEYINCQTSSSV